MQATTVKIESPLLNELKRRRPDNKSISAYVRDILEKEMQNQKMIEAAREYNQFLLAHPKEEEWLEEWDNALSAYLSD
jgi:hypothetical protein